MGPLYSRKPVGFIKMPSWLKQAGQGAISGAFDPVKEDIEQEAREAAAQGAQTEIQKVGTYAAAGASIALTLAVIIAMARK